jgi:hypothetical protein
VTCDISASESICVEEGSPNRVEHYKEMQILIVPGAPTSRACRTTRSHTLCLRLRALSNKHKAHVIQRNRNKRFATNCHLIVISRCDCLRVQRGASLPFAAVFNRTLRFSLRSIVVPCLLFRLQRVVRCCHLSVAKRSPPAHAAGPSAKAVTSQHGRRNKCVPSGGSGLKKNSS